MIKKTLVDVMHVLKEGKIKRKVRTDKAFLKSRLEADIIRLVHSIEKGLSISSPRLGFGNAKIKKLDLLIDEYIRISPLDLMCVYMALGALQAYCDYHDLEKYTSAEFTRAKEIYEKIKGYCDSCGDPAKYGGVKKILFSDFDWNINDIGKFFRTRNSIREFENTPVDSEKIKKAIALAQCAPSACNRQAVRVYSVDCTKFIEDYGNNLEGVGGFADKVDKFLIITGKLSAYDEFEHNQYIVSAGIFAGYLSLALHAYKIGACVIQRPLRPTKQWTDFRKKNNIPEDEQVICILGIGNMKKATTVPVSYRYPIEKIFRELE